MDPVKLLEANLSSARNKQKAYADDVARYSKMMVDAQREVEEYEFAVKTLREAHIGYSTIESTVTPKKS